MGIKSSIYSIKEEENLDSPYISFCLPINYLHKIVLSVNNLIVFGVAALGIPLRM